MHVPDERENWTVSLCGAGRAKRAWRSKEFERASIGTV